MDGMNLINTSLRGGVGENIVFLGGFGKDICDD